ncbi:hypothetical protein J7K42_01410 [bacterium]|nr:hypothetical protein [bacterium]
MKPKTAQEIQHEIFKKMSTEKKIKLTSDFFLLGKKLEKLRKQSESTRQLEDIESVLKISEVDLEYIRKWTERQSTKEIFDKIYQKIKSKKV